METLEAIDRAIVLAINGWHSSFFDTFFWVVSAKLTWIPLYILCLYLAYKQYGKRVFFFLGLVVLTIAVADTSSVMLFKEMVQRYRPSHNLILKDVLHLHKQADGTYYAGGQYGFVSAHATNFFALVVVIGLGLKPTQPNLWKYLFAIAIMVAYSRIYLGVHYLSDVVVGGLWGAFIAGLTYRFGIQKLNSMIS